MAVTVSGYSDDLIEIEGDVRDEFDACTYSDQPYDIVGLSNGVVLKIVYGLTDGGTWQITILQDPLDSVVLQHAPVEGAPNDYTDVATVHGEITWAQLLKAPGL